MILKVINRDRWYVVLEVHYFHRSYVEATIIGSVIIYNWLPSPEYSNLSEIELLILKRVFTESTSESRVCIHGYCDSTNGSIVENIFLDELFLTGLNDKCLCHSFHIVVFHRSICKHVHSFLVLILLETNAACVERTVYNSETNIGVVANHVKIRSRSD